jgi:two-component system, chemotaxis family, chemotaxis protein CheY
MAGTVMIVDDSASLREALRATLESADYRVLEAEDGPEALRQLAREHVDLAIFDVKMPLMDGIELLQTLKKLPQHRFLPVIMLSTESAERRKLAGQLAGAKAWIVKPFRPDQILHAVSKLILPLG